MASSDIKYSLYKDSDKLQETRLRSILLFNGKVEKQKRQDLMTKAILSLILKENGSSSRKQILNQLSEQFHVSYRDSDLDIHIKKLYDSGLLTSKEEPFSVIEKDENCDFFRNLDDDTNALFDSIIEKTKSLYGQVNNPDTLKNAIRKALSVFFGMYGYTFFGAQKKESDSVKNAAVKVIEGDISDNRLVDSLIIALADVIEHPDQFQERVLTQWARAFVAMETMSFDPLLNNLKSKNLKEKEFIIDTDVALHCLATKSRFSKDYHQMIDKLKAIGCKLYIVQDVINEIRKHIDAAEKQARFYGNRIVEFPDDVLYEKISNVFIDDYVHIAREAEEPITFREYIEEFYDSEHPDSQVLLKGKLKHIFSEKALNCNFDIDSDSPKFMALCEEVYNLTKMTPKSQSRSEEENRAVSKLDAYLYMMAAKNNEGRDSLEILAGKTYILTDSSRAMRAAANLNWKKEDVVCHPNALMAILMDIGAVKSEDSIINLFDNPFLVHVADKIWGIVDPLIQEGATIKNKGFERLKYDVDKRYDMLLTEQTPEDKKRTIMAEYSIYLPEMVDAGKEREANQLKEIERLKKENVGLRKSLIEARSTKAKSTQTRNQRSSRKKKKSNR